ncbi:ABC transporter ATP-binding protein/permease [Candidatus Bipolaricaulota bacterium]|nr:ABC transporter ATP-binding protein/permease [Candidatus Bipolaricaulota bacterium]
MPGPGGGRGHGATRIERAKDTRGTLRRLVEHFRPYRRAILFVFLLAIIGTGVGLVGPYLLGKAVDALARGLGLAALARIIVLMIGVYILSWLANAGQGVIVATVAQKMMRTLRNELFDHLQLLSLQFFDGRTSGELMSRLTNDMDAVSRVLSQNVTQLFTGLLTLVGVLVIMFVLNPLLALGSLLVFPLMIGLVGLVGTKTRKAFRGYQAGLGSLNGILEETYSGQRVVTAYGQEAATLAKFDAANETVRKVGTHAMTYALLVMPMMGILSNANIAVVVGLGGWMTIAGMATVGTIASFIGYSNQFAQPLRQLGDLYNQVQSALAGAERIFSILDTKPDLTDREDAIELARVEGDVVFDNVSFSYVPNVPVLKQVSLHALPGQRVALVGPTGAGKTTIVNLLSRFYDLNDGAIRIDGRDIRDIMRASLRRNLGTVLQQTFLFAESVMENIRYGRLDASDEEVIAAAKLARADQFIRHLPQGYQEVLSERGANLSEGQRQLLAIARAILADPRVLILDEATSSVDTRTEVHIQQALLELMKGRTSFVIAHRLSTIRGADQVIMIDEGRIVERGTHEELMSLKGAYYRLFLSQFRGKEEPERSS